MAVITLVADSWQCGGQIPMHVNESKHQLHTTYGKSKHNAFFFNKIFTYFFPSARTISLALDKFHVYDKVVLGHMHLFTHLIQSCPNYFIFNPLSSFVVQFLHSNPTCLQHQKCLIARHKLGHLQGPIQKLIL